MGDKKQKQPVDLFIFGGHEDANTALRAWQMAQKVKDETVAEDEISPGDDQDSGSTTVTTSDDTMDDEVKE